MKSNNRLIKTRSNNLGIIAILNKEDEDVFKDWISKRPSSLKYITISEIRRLEENEMQKVQQTDESMRIRRRNKF